MPNEEKTFVELFIQLVNLLLIKSRPGLDTVRVFDRYFFFVTDVIAPGHAGFFLRQAGLEDAANVIGKRVIEQLIFAEGFLTEEFMAGDRFSMADISAFTIASSVRDRLDWKSHPRLADWFYAIEARPAVQRGLNAFQ